MMGERPFTPGAGHGWFGGWMPRLLLL